MRKPAQRDESAVLRPGHEPALAQRDGEGSAVHRARRGDMAAHAELYAAFAPRIYTLARRMLLSRPLAEDVLQETFVEVIRKIDSYRGDADVGAWIKRIAINKCLMHLRSSWSSRRGTMPAAETMTGPDNAEALDQQIALEAALAQLSGTARFVVWLHDVEGYTHKEIGGMLRRTASFSKSQLARAHEQLRGVLKDRAALEPTARHNAEPTAEKSPFGPTVQRAAGSAIESSTERTAARSDDDADDRIERIDERIDDRSETQLCAPVLKIC